MTTLRPQPAKQPASHVPGCILSGKSWALHAMKTRLRLSRLAALAACTEREKHKL